LRLVINLDMDFLWCFLSRHTIPHMKGVTSSCLALSSPLHSSISITARSCPHSSPQTLVTHETNDKKAGRRNKGEREREKEREHNQTSDTTSGKGVCMRRRKGKNSTMIYFPEPLNYGLLLWLHHGLSSGLKNR